MREVINKIARNLGFDAVAITSAENLSEDGERFEQWLEAKYHGQMSYLARSSEQNSSPRLLLSEVKSVITLAANYFKKRESREIPLGRGRIALYAQGRDYHGVIGRRLRCFVRELERELDRRVKSRVCVDAAPVLERALANRAGLGFFGKNTNLILPRRGSYLFLAEVLVDVELPSREWMAPINCGTCTRCIDACPTDAFSAPFVLDSNRCISYQTIENRGSIPPELRRRLGDWLFGCDICQEVCPFNRFSEETAWTELRPEAGVGANLDLMEVLTIQTDAEFRERFQGTALLRAKRTGLLRNAAIVAANSGATEALESLRRLSSADENGVIREHAAWAVAQLQEQSREARESEAVVDRPAESVNNQPLRQHTA